MALAKWFQSSTGEAQFLRLVLDHVSDCLVVVDTAGIVVMINGPYCRLLGGKEEDFVGRHITEVVSPDTRLHHVAQGNEIVMGAPLTVREHRLITRQVPVLQDGEIVGAVGLALFRNMDHFRKTYSLTSQEGLTLDNPRSTWTARHNLADILGEGPRVELLRERLRQAARHALPVLIEGETGTGKELAAHAIHNLSERIGRPFVWVNCAAIPRDLIEAELFGYEGGSFTGARARGKPGKFELANGGTLFLDEIGEMPTELQASLLRAVQSCEISRVGGSVPISLDVRIVCATNRSLEALVAAGEFRQDLYYRIGVFTVQVPALREREDLGSLIDQMLDRLAAREGIPAPQLDGISKGRLLAHRWPGNVRELEAVLLRYLYTREIELREPARSVTSPRTLDLQSAVGRAKEEAIRRALVAANNNREQAARLLGISRASLYRELQALGPGGPPN